MGDRALAFKNRGECVGRSRMIEVDRAGAGWRRGGVRISAEQDLGRVQRPRCDRRCVERSPDIERALFADRNGTITVGVKTGDGNRSAVANRKRAWPVIADEECGPNIPNGGRR